MASPDVGRDMDQMEYPADGDRVDLVGRDQVVDHHRDTRETDHATKSHPYLGTN